MTITYFCCIYCLILCNVSLFESKSITFEKEHGKGILHRVSDKISAEDWVLECRGMSCEQWGRTTEKLSQIENLDEYETGCIWLTENDVDDLLYGVNSLNNHHRNKRKLKKIGITNKWTLPIHYRFDGTQSSFEIEIVRNATKHWERETCIKFKELDTFEEYPDTHIVFIKKYSGCRSYIGKTTFKAQPINLNNCPYLYGSTIHEIGHALGMYHEQQRSDRDRHIKINQDNLGGYASQFSKRNTYDLGVQYDVGSIMHYGPRDASKNGENVLETLNPLYQHNMGQRTGLSYNDAKLMNEVYCKDVCTNSLSMPCLRGGYQDPNHCSRCRCPPGFDGKYCEVLAASNRKCGGEIYLNNGSAPMYITSPGYDDHKSYDNYVECNWLIKVPSQERIMLAFEGEFRVYCQYQEQCFHWVEVKYQGNLDMQGPRFCCYTAPTAVLISDHNEMVIAFRSNIDTNDPGARIGFKAKIEIATKNTNLPTTVTSPSPKPTISSSSSATPSTKHTKVTGTTQPIYWSTDRQATDVTTSTSSTVNEDDDDNNEEMMNTAGYDFLCTFEKHNLCGIKQNKDTDEFDWTIQKGATPSRVTGPSSAFQGDYYIYIEASAPRKLNDTARIELPPVPNTHKYCLSFWYHMFGYHINKLVIYKQTVDGSIYMVWGKSKQQGNKWFSVSISVDMNINDKIIIDGVRGEEYSGDISLDNISLNSC